jgi:hypothetical protein
MFWLSTLSPLVICVVRTTNEYFSSSVSFVIRRHFYNPTTVNDLNVKRYFVFFKSLESVINFDSSHINIGGHISAGWTTLYGKIWTNNFNLIYGYKQDFLKVSKINYTCIIKVDFYEPHHLIHDTIFLQFFIFKNKLKRYEWNEKRIRRNVLLSCKNIFGYKFLNPFVNFSSSNFNFTLFFCESIDSFIINKKMRQKAELIFFFWKQLNWMLKSSKLIDSITWWIRGFKLNSRATPKISQNYLKMCWIFSNN